MTHVRIRIDQSVPEDVWLRLTELGVDSCPIENADAVILVEFGHLVVDDPHERIPDIDPPYCLSMAEAAAYIAGAVAATNHYY